MNIWTLETRVEPGQGTAVVIATGRIGAAAADRFAEALRRAGHEAARLIVDLTGVDYISGPGISALLEAADGAEIMILCGLGEAVRNTLELAGVTGRVLVVETRAGAVELVARDPRTPPRSRG